MYNRNEPAWNQKMTKEQKLMAVDMVRQGLSENSVAEFYGVSRQYVNNICKIAGVIPKKKNILTSKEQEAHVRIGNITRQAIAKGVLIPEPCGVCGVFGKDEKGKRRVHAHHCDYNKPLEVMWLCEKHHHEWHKNNVSIKCVLT